LVDFARPYALLLLLPALAWIYWTYTSRKLPVKRMAALWLLRSKTPVARRSRFADLRLAMLLLSGLLIAFAFADPRMNAARPKRLAIVLDASASMTAGDKHTRFGRARKRAAEMLLGVRTGLLVRAGISPTASGPATGRALRERLGDMIAGDRHADLRAAVAAARTLLPGAPVVVIGDTAPAPELHAAFLSVAGTEENVGITALSPRFAAVFNAGSRPWRGLLTSGEDSFTLNIASGRFATVSFSTAATRRTAALAPGDRMDLDQTAYLAYGSPRVRLASADPVLVRALSALNARVDTGNAPFEIRTGTPPEPPAGRPIVYFAAAGGPPRPVFDFEPLHPLTRSVELVGYSLPAPPPPPGKEWSILARHDNGDGVIFARGNELYLPPASSMRDIPALIVLLYNWLAPQIVSFEPLGWRGRLEPGFYQGRAVSLLNYGETRLPRSDKDNLQPLTSQKSVAPWLALLAAALLVLQAPRPQRKAVG